MPGIKLTQKQKKAVKQWLLFSERLDEVCPFGDNCEGFALCKSWFPHTSRKLCPCHAYTLSHVRRVAKRMVEENV